MSLCADDACHQEIVPVIRNVATVPLEDSSTAWVAGFFEANCDVEAPKLVDPLGRGCPAHDLAMSRSRFVPWSEVICLLLTS